MSRIPFLVAMPNRVMKPIIAGILNIPEVNQIVNTPPIKANGRLRRIIPASLKFLNSYILILKINKLFYRILNNLKKERPNYYD